MNAGFLYGGLAGMAFVLAKTLKYSGGGRQDLPWAILIVLVASVVGGALCSMSRALLNPRRKPDREDCPREDRKREAVKDDPERWHGSN